MGALAGRDAMPESGLGLPGVSAAVDPLGALLGDAPAMVTLRASVRRLLQREAALGRMPPVLILGETGTGKGLLARTLHRAGPRSSGPFVDVSCAAIPETLLEAEMFGYERGAFTDARQSKPGLFQTAHRGTIFLDEVGLLPGALQTKLLKVLEDRVVRRLGSTRTEPVDAWVLAATNEDLLTAMREQRFRQDLYHRLAVVRLSLPPLRERGEDVVRLAEHFLARACADYGLPPKTLSSDARRGILDHPWPGNVRELSNVIERATLLSEGAILTREALDLIEGPAGARGTPRESNPKAIGSLEDTVRTRLLQTLTDTGWNISRTAAVLGIARNTVHAHIEKYGLRSGSALSPSRRRAPRGAHGAATPSGAPVEPTRIPLRWELRRLALLRTRLVNPAGTDVPVTGALDLISEKISGFGGHIDGISANGVWALFGMDSSEETTVRAAHAAMVLHKAAERAQREEGVQWSLKTSLHTGQFRIAVAASGQEVDADGKREAWNTLEQVLESTSPGQIVATPACAALLRRRLDLVPAQTGSPAFRLVGLHRPDSALGASRGRFVGRQREMETLRALLDAAGQGHGQVVAITGDPGVGKSRFLLELRRGFAGERVTHLEGHCLPFLSTVPYGPILEIIRTACGISELDSPVTSADKLRLALQALGMDPAQSMPHLLQLLAIDETPAPLTPGGPEILRAHFFQTVRQLLLRTSERQTVVVVVEDLHWADHLSETFLESLVDMLPRSRILLITTYRVDYRPPWLNRSYATQIALQPLSPEDSFAIVSELLEGTDASEELTQLILARAEGNPLFLEELARAVLEEGGAVGPSGVTDTIQDVLSTRLDRLDAEPKRILTTAAVIGKDVPLALLRAVAGAPEAVLLNALIHLQKGEFLHETGSGLEPEYTFKHVLIRDVAYDSLLPGFRRALHARTVECIEALLPDRSPQVERLAYHAVHAEDWERAVTYLGRAGAKAFARSANREALGYLRQALGALAHLPETRETLQAGIDLRLELRAVLFLLGDLSAVGSDLDDAARLALRLEDPLRLGRVWTYMTHYHWITGHSRETRAFGERALRLASQSGDPLLKLTANLYVGLACQTWSEYREAELLLRGNIDLLEGTRGLERLGQVAFPAVMTRTYLVHCFGDQGRFAEGIALGAEAIALAESLEHPYSVGLACWPLAYLHCVRGDVETAFGLLKRCAIVLDVDRQASGRQTNDPVEAARNSTSLLSGSRLLWLLGYGYVLSGRVGDGVKLLEEAAAAFEAVGMRVYSALVAVHLAEGYLAAGRLADARAAGERAFALADQREQRGMRAYALRFLGEASSHPDSTDLARSEDCYRRALLEAEELGMRPLEARCHLGLGRLGGRYNQPFGAEHQSRGRAMLEEMEMRVPPREAP